MRMNNRVNVKAVCVLLVGSAVCAAATHLVHTLQMKRNARALLEQANLAEQEGRPEQAADHLAQYVGLVPGDAEVLGRYGLLLYENAKTPRARMRAFEVLENALRRDPGRSDLRRKVAAITIKLGRFKDARDHLQMLMKEAPTDVEVLWMCGQGEAGAQEYAKAAQFYTRATDQAAGNVPVAVEYANLLRDRLGQPSAADGVMDAMLRANHRDLQARLEAAHYFRQSGALDKAEEHVRFALEKLGSRDVELLLLAAEVARARGEPEKARAWVDEGRARYPADRRLTREAARLALRRGQPDQARALLRPLLKDLPDNAEELWELGNVLVDLDEEKGAQRVLGRLASRGLAAHLRARLAIRRKAWGEARRVLEQALPGTVRLPELARQLNALLGECYLRLDNPDLAASAFRRALEGAPLWLPALRGHASALVALGKLDRAADEYAKLAARAPEAFVERVRLLLLHNLRLPAAERQWAEIERALDALTKGKETVSEARLLRAEMEAARGQLPKARELAETARKDAPEEIGPWLFLAGLAGMEGRTAEVPALLEQAETSAGRRVEWQIAWLRYALGASTAGLKSPTLEVLDLRVRVLHANRRSNEAADLVRAYAAEKEARLDVAAWLLDEVGRADEAEALYRKHAETSRDSRSVLLLARHFAQRGDLGRALSVCEQARQTCPAEAVAGVCVGILESPKATDGQRQRVGAWLAEAIQKRPRSVALRVGLAQLEDLRGRHVEAIAAYRRALDEAPRNTVSLNNLAYLLALKEGATAEALALIERALEQVGPQAELLDTRALVRLVAKEPALAVKDLQQAIAQAPSATTYFHLAQAHHATGDWPAAAEAYRKVTDLGLREADLHPLERPALGRLARQMERR